MCSPVESGEYRKELSNLASMLGTAFVPPLMMHLVAQALTCGYYVHISPSNDAFYDRHLQQAVHTHTISDNEVSVSLPGNHQAWTFSIQIYSQLYPGTRAKGLMWPKLAFSTCYPQIELPGKLIRQYRRAHDRSHIAKGPMAWWWETHSPHRHCPAPTNPGWSHVTTGCS